LHHLLYKANHKEAATVTGNFFIGTRGSSSSGLIGTHEGVFHLITSGNDSSIYTREVAGVIGVIKRLIASSHKVDPTKAISGTHAWLTLEKASGRYSVPATAPTAGFRAKSSRIQRAAAAAREARKLMARPYLRFLKSSSYAGKDAKVLAAMKKMKPYATSVMHQVKMSQAFKRKKGKGK
jgi:hypothetical protein